MCDVCGKDAGRNKLEPCEMGIDGSAGSFHIHASSYQEKNTAW